MDAQTLLIVNLTTSLIIALVMFGAAAAYKFASFLLHWALASACFVGYASFRLFSHLFTPEGYTGIYLGNVLMICAYMFFLSGTCHFLQKPIHRMFLLAIILLSSALNLSDFVAQSVQYRMLINYPLLLGLNLYLMYRLKRHDMAALAVVCNIFIVVLALNMMQLALRWGLNSFMLSGWQSPLTAAQLINIGAISMMAFMLGSMICCLLLLNRQQYIQLQQLAQTDPLTGWLNRQSMQQRMEMEWQRCHRTAQPFSVLLFDIDHFKQINDRYGHAQGDLVLKQLSQLVKQELREYDLQFRTGGEEFLVCLPAVSGVSLLDIAERLRQKVAHYQFDQLNNPNGHLNVTISIGVATAQQQQSWGVVVSQADQALYQAKRCGRNQVVHDQHEAESQLLSSLHPLAEI